MCKDEILDRVLGTIESIGFPVDGLHRESHLQPIAMDYLDQAELLSQLEEEFTKELLEDWQFYAWQTIGDICRSMGGH